LHFDVSFADALLLMPKFASKIKSLLTTKDKLFELAKIPLNENCSAMLLKKLGDPGKFLIPYRSITHPKGVAENVLIKVGKFHFLTDFVVVDFEAGPRVPLILGRSFLRTGRALIDVYEVTFNLNQTTRYSSTYDDLSWNPTSTSEHIISDSSPPTTPFEGSDFILEEIEAYVKDESISPEIDHADCDSEGDICLIEKLLNNDPFQHTLIDLKQGEVVKAKSSIEEPPKLELKDLPSHLEYAYLEGVDKLPVIIAKDLKVDEKEALLKVLKSHKRAIAWKITDIKGVDKLPVIIAKDLKVDEKEALLKVLKSHKRAIAWKITDIKGIDPWKRPLSPVPMEHLLIHRIPFSLCNAPGIFQRCMMAIFHDMIEKTTEVFMDDFLVFGDSFLSCLSHLDTMLQRFNQDFSKIARTMTYLLEKETPFVFSKDCIDAFETLKKKLTEASILVVPDWNLPLELMCDASDFATGAVLVQ
nr:reverse transcriptase domain-containing protein [Tanacetum cinerariifolium]